ncbi:MAG: MipA/OmpV family protein [Rhodospirillales bacterium]
MTATCKGRSGSRAPSTKARLLATLLLSAAWAEPLVAEESGWNYGGEWSGFVALGVGAAPDYEGSDEYEVIPLPIARVRYGQIGVEIEGLGGRVDLSPFEGFGFGPAINYRFGRNNVDDPQISQLSDIDNSLEIGGFARFGQPVGLTSNDEAVLRLDVLADVINGHSGFVATASAAYSFRPTDRLGLTLGASSSWMSENYADSFFSISSQDAATSGLPAYQAESGIKDASLNLVATYALTDTWGLIATGSTGFLLGEAADSPVVKSRVQGFGGLAVSYRF